MRDGKALLFSKCALDAQPYNSVWDDVAWENCTLRHWLNETFFGAAFNGAEKAKIRNTLVTTGNPSSGLSGGNVTTDRMFLLNCDDAINTGYGFSDRMEDEDGFLYAPDPARECKASEYAKARGVSWDDKSDGHYGNCDWWLLSPSDGASYGATVLYDGRVNAYGDYIDCTYIGVRPAMWIEV